MLKSTTDMNNKIKLTTYQWIELLTAGGISVRIIDPDGWDRNLPDCGWSEPITFGDFFEKCCASTTNGFNWDIDVLKNAIVKNIDRFLF